MFGLWKIKLHAAGRQVRTAVCMSYSRTQRCVAADETKREFPSKKASVFSPLAAEEKDRESVERNAEKEEEAAVGGSHLRQIGQRKSTRKANEK